MKRIVFAAMLFIAACTPSEPGISGRWRNRNAQLLIVDPSSSGTVYQEAPCAPPLSVKIKRDPYEGYAIMFLENQPIYFPLAQKDIFAPSEFFCASKDSVPMCRFCRVDGKNMECNTTEQKIAGHSSMVTHDCVWERVEGTGTSTTGGSCPPGADASSTSMCLGMPSRDAGPPRDAIPIPDLGNDGGDPADAGVVD